MAEPPEAHPALSPLIADRPDGLRFATVIAQREARTAPWPGWVPADVQQAYRARGIDQPWEHQARTADLAWAGTHVAVATGTASGKSLAFWLPVLAAVHQGRDAIDGRGATALYLAPTKALAHDQQRSLSEVAVTGARVAIVDGDTPHQDRAWARAHATIVLTNPDLIHASMLGGHPHWAAFLRRLQYVIVDEAHAYRGLFGAHVGVVLRRLRRACARYGSEPTFIAASATIAEPASLLERLIGAPASAVTEDASPAPTRTLALWESPEIDSPDERPPQRRSALTEAADLLADLCLQGLQAIAFVRSRRGAEAVALIARDRLAEVDPALPERVTSYRGGYLPEERRDIEARLRSGQILGLASTNALELGIDISGMDAVLTVGWPGTRASLWQQFGRAGRGDTPALAMFIARDDPLDSYVVRHPASILGTPVEAVVLDPANPRVLAPHLCAAASEFPLTDDEAIAWFGDKAPGILARLGAEGLLRRRPTGWFWTKRERASDLADLRGTGGPPITILESGTGRILGTVDHASAHAQVHAGAVYTHLGSTYLIEDLDLGNCVAIAHQATVDFTTHAQEVSDVRITAERTSSPWGAATMSFGDVDVTAQVVGFLRRRLVTGEVLSEERLDLPERLLATTATWWTVDQSQVQAAELAPADVPGAAHAAEHASIGLLPLFATCDRWDIGGLSTAMHPDTGRPTIFVYDGASGGAGFAERGYQVARQWLGATRALIAECACPDGCPACIQSPKCGNGNNPLDKAGAVRLLDQLLAG
ncbi:MAG: DEAD/DEAH box helicase [Actinomycetales bacterium]|nr:DEAD/DEAH box helicase [Actinomycetales bacterium]